MTRSDPPSPSRASAAGAGPGDTAAPAKDGGETLAQADAVAESVRRELGRLTALFRRHFSTRGEDSLLPALVDTSDPVAAATAHAFLNEVRHLAELIQHDAAHWAASPPTAGVFADFRRETMALLAGVEERMHQSPAELLPG